MSATSTASKAESAGPGGGSARGPFKRVLLKLSGESFSEPGQFGIDPGRLATVAHEIRLAIAEGAQLAVVVGGGNIIRGATLAEAGDIQQATADYMGMLGTIINAVALREKLLTLGVDSRVQSALDVRAVAEPFIRNRAIRHLEKGRVVILAAGTGNPFFTTDTCASLRATELECDVLMKATKVDGVYDADPATVSTATRFDSLTFGEAISRGLAVMDMTALAMCQERDIPVLVFSYHEEGNVARAIRGEPIGTLVTKD